MLQGEIVFELRLKGRTCVFEGAEMGWPGTPGGGNSVSKSIEAGTRRHVWKGLGVRECRTQSLGAECLGDEKSQTGV